MFLSGLVGCPDDRPAAVALRSVASNRSTIGRLGSRNQARKEEVVRRMHVIVSAICDERSLGIQDVGIALYD
jgi:hypothetical protein